MDLQGTYQGQYNDNMREGSGEYKYVSGEFYIGDWWKNECRGNGSWSNNKGQAYNGEWREGKYHGYGVAVYRGMPYWTQMEGSIKEISRSRRKMVGVDRNLRMEILTKGSSEMIYLMAKEYTTGTMEQDMKDSS